MAQTVPSMRVCADIAGRFYVDNVRVNGIDPATIPLEQIARHVGFVPQNPGRLLFNETVERELEFTCRAHNLSTEKIPALLERLGLSELRLAYPRDTSTGERQRVALASILIAEPRVLLLDEPTRGVDVASKASIYRRIGEAAAAGHAVIFVSSYLPELLGVCDSIGVMCRGVLSAIKPANEWTEHDIIATAIASRPVAGA